MLNSEENVDDVFCSVRFLFPCMGLFSFFFLVYLLYNPLVPALFYFCALAYLVCCLLQLSFPSIT